MLRADNVPLLQPQPLREYPHQRGIECEGTALKDDGGRQLQSLGKPADGLLGNGVKSRQGDVRPLRPLDQQGLDVGFGKDTAPAGDAVNGLACGGQLFKFVRRHVQQCGDLVDEGAGATGAASVHTHVGGLEPAGSLVVMEKDYLGVLSAQLHGCADIGVQRPDGGSVGHHLLDIVRTQSGGNGTSAGAADTDPEPYTGKPPGGFFQKLPDGGCLMGVMPLISGKQYLVGTRVCNDSFHSGGTNIHPKPQNI